MRQPGFFDIDERYAALNAMGDPLVVLNNSIPWENFRRICSKVHGKERKSPAGRKPLDPMMMFNANWLVRQWRSHVRHGPAHTASPVCLKQVAS
ncbi:MAG: hypothetical protein MN733_21155 [Nitrososphaera sp.]|nr:hypothetical protein [Nitrososphaera sp.]